MSLTLSWDLFVVVFFGIIIAYSFIIGKHQSVKVIIATYISLVAGQGIGNLLHKATIGSQPYLSSFGLTVNITILGGTKLFIFIAAIVFLTSRGGFEIQYKSETGFLGSMLLTALLGFATAGLLLSTLLTFAANAPLLDARLAEAASLSPIVNYSKLMRVMIVHQDLWFSFPALLLIGVGLVGQKE